MVTRGKHYFISRPRRFGKSLTVSTLEALFKGERDLFKGLWIDSSNWSWEKYPVIRLDMGKVNSFSVENFVESIIDQMVKIANQYNVELSTNLPYSSVFDTLILKLSKLGKVVVLVDEYDKPLNDQINHLELAMEIRDHLRKFYEIIKSNDEHMKFIFLTGVTKFSKVSVFSGLNNLTDVSLSSDYSCMMGYTKEELVINFDTEVKNLAEALSLSIEECYQSIKEWYNGYRFSKDENFVYNPFSVLNLLNDMQFKSYWFSTGTPTFLLDLIKSRRFDMGNIEQLKIDESGFESFDIDNLSTLPLLYQAGYLTIKSFEPILSTYRLDFPNREVSQSFTQSLIRYFSSENANSINYINELSYNLIQTTWDSDKFFNYLNHLLNLIPYDLYLKEEKYFHSLFYLIIKLTGVKVSAEVHTQLGRVDATLEMPDKIIIFELKLNKTAQIALDQIKDNKYYEIFSDSKLPIYLVGINFNSHTRSIDGYKVECLEYTQSV
jgi:hypothetical protein